MCVLTMQVVVQNVIDHSQENHYDHREEYHQNVNVDQNVIITMG